MAPVRVVLADDHPVVRDGLRAVLEGSAAAEVVGEASTRDELLAVVAEVGPDVAVVDVEMPGSGLAAVRDLAARGDVAVVVLTMHDDDATVLAALRAGARAFVVKGAPRPEVLSAVLGAARGEAVLSSAVAPRALDLLTSTAGRPARAFPALTPREHEVLELIAGGHDNGEIAARLGLTRKTVRNLVSSVLTKLQVADRAKAVVMARDAGLGG